MMQKFLLGIICGFLPLLALADLPPLTQDPVTNSSSSVPAFVNSAPPATQQYQSVDDPMPTAVPTVAPAKPAALSITKKAVTKAPAKLTNEQSAQLNLQLKTIEARLTQFTQNYLLAQQESKQQMALLEQKTIALQAEVEQLLTVLKTMNQQVDQLKLQSNQHQQWLMDLRKDGPAFQAMLAKLRGYSADTNNMFLLATLLVLLIIWWLVIRVKKQRAQMKINQQVREEDDTKNEYDFMGSSEGIPAQLDLARAYIAMENYVAAENVLHQVLAKGDADQQQQARELLEKIAH